MSSPTSRRSIVSAAAATAAAVAHDDGQHVVEVVRHAAGEPSQGLHLLPLPQLLLEAALVRDVAGVHEEAADAGGIEQILAGGVEESPGAIGVPEA
jgi:hypothetical protein